MEKLFKQYGLEVGYVEHRLRDKKVKGRGTPQKKYLDDGLDYGKRVKYHKSEYFRCVQIVLEHGGYYTGTNITSRRHRCNKSSKKV